MKERRFARKAVKHLLEAYSTVSIRQPDLSGTALYKAILLQTEQVDESLANTILREAEDSIDEWTAPGRMDLGFREVAHYFIVSQYLATGHKGTVISLRKIIDALVPANI